MKNILVASDGSAQAGRAVARAAELARMSGAALTIIHVQDARPIGEMEAHFAEDELSGPLKYYNMPLLADEDAPMRTSLKDTVLAHDRQSLALRQVISDRILEEAQAIAGDAGMAGARTQSAAGDAATEIVAAAKTVGADLIVLGRSGVSGIAELLLGSVSRKVLHLARCDVLMVA